MGASTKPEGQPTDMEFIRTALDEIRHLTEQDAIRQDEPGKKDRPAGRSFSLAP